MIKWIDKDGTEKEVKVKPKNESKELQKIVNKQDPFTMPIYADSFERLPKYWHCDKEDINNLTKEERQLICDDFLHYMVGSGFADCAERMFFEAYVKFMKDVKNKEIPNVCDEATVDESQ